MTRRVVRKKKAKRRVRIPESRTKPSDVLDDYHFLIHGEKKIGKTTLSAQGNTLVVSADPLRKGLEIKQVHVSNHQDLFDVLDQLRKLFSGDPTAFDKVVLDRVDLMYVYCQDEICKREGVSHPSDVGYAKAWHALRDEFTRIVLGYMNLGCGCWFVCHSEWKELKTRTGLTREKLVPNIAGRAEEILNGFVDGWFAYDYNDTDRVLIVIGSDLIGAGHAIDQSFRTSDGRLIEEIYMGTSPKEAYQNFLRAFRNEQTYADMEELRKSKKKRKKTKQIKT